MSAPKKFEYQIEQAHDERNALSLGAAEAEMLIDRAQ